MTDKLRKPHLCSKTSANERNAPQHPIYKAFMNPRPFRTLIPPPADITSAVILTAAFRSMPPAADDASGAGRANIDYQGVIEGSIEPVNQYVIRCRRRSRILRSVQMKFRQRDIDMLEIGALTCTPSGTAEVAIWNFVSDEAALIGYQDPEIP